MSANQFSITIPVKPYVKRFIELNYGLPADFSKHPEILKFIRRCLKKPDTRYDKVYDNMLFSFHTEKVEFNLSQDDFYRYGWEFTKTDIIAFGKLFETKAKTMMRTLVGVYCTFLPESLSINRFQERFGFNEDVWAYQSIKKDFQRSGQKEKIDFNTEIFDKIERICLYNLYKLGTISHKTNKIYESA